MENLTQSERNLLANIRCMGRAVEANSNDVFVSWLPLYHDMGLIGSWLMCLHSGLPLTLLPLTRRQRCAGRRYPRPSFTCKSRKVELRRRRKWRPSTYSPGSGVSELVPMLTANWRRGHGNSADRIYTYPDDWPPPPDRFPMAPNTALAPHELWTCCCDSDAWRSPRSFVDRQVYPKIRLAPE